MEGDFGGEEGVSPEMPSFDMDAWLDENKLSGLKTLFAERQIIDLTEFYSFSDSELNEWGKTLGLDTLQRRRFVKAIVNDRPKEDDSESAQKSEVASQSHPMSANEWTLDSSVTAFVSTEEASAFDTIRKEFSQSLQVSQQISVGLENLSKVSSNCEQSIMVYTTQMNTDLIEKSQQIDSDLSQIVETKKGILKTQYLELSRYAEELSQGRQKFDAMQMDASQSSIDRQMFISELNDSLLKHKNVNFKMLETTPNIGLFIDANDFTTVLNQYFVNNCDQPFAPSVNVTKIGTNQIDIGWSVSDVELERKPIKYVIEMAKVKKIPSKLKSDIEAYKKLLYRHMGIKIKEPAKKKRRKYSSSSDESSSDSGSDSGSESDSGSDEDESKSFSDDMDEAEGADEVAPADLSRSASGMERRHSKLDKHRSKHETPLMDSELLHKLQSSSKLKWSKYESVETNIENERKFAKKLAKNRGILKIKEKIKELNDDTLYLIRVKGYNDAGYGEYSSVLAVPTQSQILQFDQKYHGNNVTFIKKTRVSHNSGRSKVFTNVVITAKKYTIFEWEVTLHQISNNSWIGFCRGPPKKWITNLNHYVGNGQNEFGVGISSGGMTISRACKGHTNTGGTVSSMSLPKAAANGDRVGFELNMKKRTCTVKWNGQTIGTPFTNLPDKLTPALSNNTGRGEHSIKFIRAK